MTFNFTSSVDFMMHTPLRNDFSDFLRRAAEFLLASTPSPPNKEYLENLISDRLSAKISEAESGSSILEEAMRMVRDRMTSRVGDSRMDFLGLNRSLGRHSVLS